MKTWMGDGCSFSSNFMTLFLKYQIKRVDEKEEDRRITDT